MTEAPDSADAPALSVVIPTFNNLDVLTTCLEAWQTVAGGQPVEIDLSFRIRRAGWKVATHGYERAGAYHDLGSTTVGVLSDAYKQRVLRNGLLFHERWDETGRRE